MKKLINESGGRIILGVNALQAKHGDIIRAVNRYKNVKIEQGGKHIKVTDTKGNVVTVFPKNIGPKGSIDTLTKIRDHLVSAGEYTPSEHENKGLTQQRKNRWQESNTSAKITPSVSDQLSKKIKLYTDLVSRPQMGEGRRSRYTRVLTQLKNRQKSISP
jgi:hypothetical protein